jgi:hypothetical protein
MLNFMYLADNKLRELMALKENDILSMDKINWWLLKYYSDYKNTKGIEQNKFLYNVDSITMRLPDKSHKNIDEIFIDTYEALDRLAFLHKNEDYFGMELEVFADVKNSEKGLKQWLKCNQTLGSEIYACFIIDYLDYSEDSFHLNIFIPSNKEYEIYIDGNEFKYTVQFLEIFNGLYWV